MSQSSSEGGNKWAQLMNAQEDGVHSSIHHVENAMGVDVLDDVGDLLDEAAALLPDELMGDDLLMGEASLPSVYSNVIQPSGSTAMDSSPAAWQVTPRVSTSGGGLKIVLKRTPKSV